MMKWALFLYLIATCIISVITDFKDGKIYNRNLKLALVPGILLVIVYYVVIGFDFRMYLLNFLSAFIIGVLFYVFKIWGAGDSKLWFLVNIIFPIELYIVTDYMVFPSVFLLAVIFIEAYAYVLLESVFFRILKKDKGFIRPREKFTVNRFFDLIFSVILISFIYMGISFLLGQYFVVNRIFFSLLGLLIAYKVTNLEFKNKRKITIVLAIAYLIVMFCFQSKTDFRMLFMSCFIVFVSMGASRFSERYNYCKIATKDVKENMILSFITVQEFSASRIKGLPKYTDESTKSRINAEEAEAVRRWEGSKYGQKEIIIVRHLPFAIFILVGVLTYTIGKVVL